MHPEIHYQLMQARVADLHRAAQRDALARAARRARRQPSGHPAPRLPAIGRRIMTVLGVLSD
jgi:hypothetical protein